MKTVLALVCCVSLAGLAGAAQNNNPNKKKGNNAPQQAAVAPQGAKKFKPVGQGMNQQHFQQNAVGNQNAFKKNKFQGNVNGQGNFNKAKNVNLNKNVNVNKNLAVNKNLNVNKKLNVNKNFKVQKFNLGNKPNGKYQAVKFNQNFKFAGAQKWKGSKYVVFKNYHPQWHDQWWWSHHHNHITIVFGAPYYWESGYWYPAWGYDPGAEYYFDGPIYASNPELDPGQVVANVQSALQQQGYYQGEIDGVLGPQTRAALAEYQTAQGIEPTGAVDEPTLETLGMA